MVGSEILYGDTDSVFWNVWPQREVDAACMAESFAMANELVKAIAPIYVYDSNHYIVLEFENVYRLVSHTHMGHNECLRVSLISGIFF